MYGKSCDVRQKLSDAAALLYCIFLILMLPFCCMMLPLCCDAWEKLFDAAGKLLKIEFITKKSIIYPKITKNW